MTTGDEQHPAALEALAELERQVQTQVLALHRVPPGAPIPAGVLALLAAPPPVLDTAALPPAAQPRLARIVEQVAAMQTELRRRQQRVVDTLVSIEQRRRPTRSAVLVDWRS